MKTLWLCADDYGQSASISSGIRTLYANRHINAVSCMTNMPCWPEEGEKLKAIAGEGYIGLHFNLTHGKPVSAQWKKCHGDIFPSLGHLIFKRFDADSLKEELCAQWSLFEAVMGRAPDFIDGHQHVHQFPKIANILLEFLSNKYFQGWVRVSAHPQFWKAKGIKGFILGLLGGWRLRRLLNMKQILCNTSFSGIYPFQEARHYGRYFSSFLKESQDNGLIMCHPGEFATDQTDPLCEYRPYELSFLASDVCHDSLMSHGFTLKKKRTELYAQA